MGVDRIKKSKPFYLKDLAVYFAIALFIVVLFLVFILIPKISGAKQEAIGFSVEYNGEIIITHRYDSNNFAVDSEFDNLVKIEENQQGYLVTIHTSSSQDEFNQLLVDNAKKTVKMIDSNCRSKQCTYLHEISENGIIYCAPRKLKITPIGGSGFIPPVTG